MTCDKIVEDIVADVLKTKINGRHKRLMTDLGADSLDLVEMVVRIESECKCELPADIYAPNANYSIDELINIVNEIKYHTKDTLYKFDDAKAVCKLTEKPCKKITAKAVCDAAGSYNVCLKKECVLARNFYNLTQKIK